jgi:hypothetical protein
LCSLFAGLLSSQSAELTVIRFRSMKFARKDAQCNEKAGDVALVCHFDSEGPLVRLAYLGIIMGKYPTEEAGIGTQ